METLNVLGLFVAVEMISRQKKIVRETFFLFFLLF